MATSADSTAIGFMEKIMKTRTDIIPPIHQRTGKKETLDLEAICAFTAVGYFMSDTTYYKGHRSLPPASEVILDADGGIVSAQPYFQWHHSPRDITLAQAVEEFAEIFESILSENSDPIWTIPISGGLDSRTLVAAAHHLRRPFRGYSYAFRDGHDETMYGRMMAEALGFDFKAYTVEKGSMWNDLERLVAMNGCYSDFTHPRQFSVYDELRSMGGTFLLGHWGDVLFDDMHVPEDISSRKTLDIHIGRIVKSGGLVLGKRLWDSWGLQGDLKEYVTESLLSVYDRIDIRENNPRLRALKSWTHAIRWTNTNLGVFREFGPNLYPYMDNRMAEFICTVPEKWLSSRRIQIEYIKMRSPALARIPWQSHYPFNLYNHGLDRMPLNLPFRAWNKAKSLFTNPVRTTRNWEIQFLGPENEGRLRGMLTDDYRFSEWIPHGITGDFLEAFLTERTPDTYHPVSMLLTLSAFHRYLLSPLESEHMINRPVV
jgi:asparagine synthetase B (glutamine-hydrolysing)